MVVCFDQKRSLLVPLTFLVHEDANVIFGALVDEEITDGTVSITVLATGFEGDRVRNGNGGAASGDFPDFLGGQ